MVSMIGVPESLRCTDRGTQTNLNLTSSLALPSKTVNTSSTVAQALRSSPKTSTSRTVDHSKVNLAISFKVTTTFVGSSCKARDSLPRPRIKKARTSCQYQSKVSNIGNMKNIVSSQVSIYPIKEETGPSIYVLQGLSVVLICQFGKRFK